jgi:hypothetical protein
MLATDVQGIRGRELEERAKCRLTVRQATTTYCKTWNRKTDSGGMRLGGGVVLSLTMDELGWITTKIQMK